MIERSKFSRVARLVLALLGAAVVTAAAACTTTSGSDSGGDPNGSSDAAGDVHARDAVASAAHDGASHASPSEDGPSGSDDSDDSGDEPDDGSAIVPDAASEAAADAQTCKLHASTDSGPSCDACMEQRCCIEMNRCMDDADCVSLFRCRMLCLIGGGPSCEADCVAAHPGKVGDLDTMLQCGQSQCASDC